MARWTSDAAADAGDRVADGLRLLVSIVWLVFRLVIVTVMVMLEPVVRIILVPIAMLGFLVTLVFGFLMGSPNFPKWGMLALSIGAMWLYWLFLGVMDWLSRGSREKH